MSVHCYRFVIEDKPQPGKVHDNVEQEVGTDNLVLRAQERAAATVISDMDAESEVTAIVGIYRVTDTMTRADARAAFRRAITNVNPSASWWTLYHHVCRHDHDPVEACDAWTLVDSDGAPPPEA